MIRLLAFDACRVHRVIEAMEDYRVAKRLSVFPTENEIVRRLECRLLLVRLQQRD